MVTTEDCLVCVKAERDCNRQLQGNRLLQVMSRVVEHPISIFICRIMLEKKQLQYSLPRCSFFGHEMFTKDSKMSSQYSNKH